MLLLILILIVLLMGFESHVGRTLESICKNINKRNQPLRAPSSAGRRGSDASRRGKKGLKSSRDKTDGAYRSGEGEEEPG